MSVAVAWLLLVVVHLVVDGLLDGIASLPSSEPRNLALVTVVLVGKVRPAVVLVYAIGFAIAYAADRARSQSPAAGAAVALSGYSSCSA